MRSFRFTMIGAIAVLGMGLGSVTAQAAPKHAPTTYYLALGDSLAAGFQTDAISQDRYCTDAVNDATGHEGYVCLMYNHLLKMYPTMKVVNYALASNPGEDTCSFRAIISCLGTTRTRAGDKPPYDVTKMAQLTAALKFMKSHPGKVRVVTLDLGGNDLLPLLHLALTGDLATAVKMMPAVEKNLAKNYDVISSKLRRADSRAHIVFINQYDPLSGVPAATFGAHGDLLLGFATQAVTQMNTEVKQAAAANHARYADVYTPFVGKSPGLTHIGESFNIHCNDLGYSLYAKVVGASFKVPGPK